MIIKKYIQHDKPWCKTSSYGSHEQNQFYDLGTFGRCIPDIAAKEKKEVIWNF